LRVSEKEEILQPESRKGYNKLTTRVLIIKQFGVSFNVFVMHEGYVFNLFAISAINLPW
jgi:hypothetical protein